jgi:protocatechuate 3,4-dioxygenase beta subunit
MSDLNRRTLLTGAGALAITSGCASTIQDAEYCLETGGGGSRITDDGPFPEDGECQVTAAQGEGPFFTADAPSSADIVEDDGGVIVNMSGRVLESGCATAVAGCVVEIWHTDAEGEYDNSGFSYRTTLTTDADGLWSLRTIQPGRYADAGVYRPSHYHVKVTVDGVERLITQLYFEGDEYLECDGIANTSLVLPWTGSEEAGIDLEMDFVLA